MEALVFDRLRCEIEAKTGPFVCILVDGKIASISVSAVSALGEDPAANLTGRAISDFLTVRDAKDGGVIVTRDGAPLGRPLRLESIDCAGRCGSKASTAADGASTC